MTINWLLMRFLVLSTSVHAAVIITLPELPDPEELPAPTPRAVSVRLMLEPPADVAPATAPTAMAISKPATSAVPDWVRTPVRPRIRAESRPPDPAPPEPNAPAPLHLARIVAASESAIQRVVGDAVVPAAAPTSAPHHALHREAARAAATEPARAAVRAGLAPSPAVRAAAPQLRRVTPPRDYAAQIAAMAERAQQVMPFVFAPLRASQPRGSVGLRVHLSRAGYVAGVSIVRSSGAAVVDRAARQIIHLAEPFAYVPIPVDLDIDFY